MPGCNYLFCVRDRWGCEWTFIIAAKYLNHIDRVRRVFAIELSSCPRDGSLRTGTTQAQVGRPTRSCQNTKACAGSQRKASAGNSRTAELDLLAPNPICRFHRLAGHVWCCPWPNLLGEPDNQWITYYRLAEQQFVQWCKNGPSRCKNCFQCCAGKVGCSRYTPVLRDDITIV